MPTAVRSHAKINLGLGIGAPRRDGFHALTTVYQTLELYDVVKVTAKPAAATSIYLTSNDSRVPTDKRNTAWKMAEHGLKMLGQKAEVEIHIEKRLPVQGGMGAGSANGVAALRLAMEHAGRDPSTLVYSAGQVLCCGRTEAEVAQRAAAIGRDVVELRQNGLAGSPAEILEKLGRLADHGADRFYLQVLDLADLDHLRLVAEEVLPHAPGG